MNKKAMELSINFIVVLILTIVVFGSSMMIAKNILDKTTELKDQLDRQTEERLEALLTSGNEEVVIAFNKKEAGRGEAVVFGVGVQNLLGQEEEFGLTVGKAIAVYSDGEQLSPGWENSWTYISNIEIGDIKNNAYKMVSVPIITGDDAIPGATYVFNIEVEYGGNPYPAIDPIKKIYITIT